jgi:hypothetical protein
MPCLWRDSAIALPRRQACAAVRECLQICPRWELRLIKLGSKYAMWKHWGATYLLRLLQEDEDEHSWECVAFLAQVNNIAGPFSRPR